MNVGLIGLGNMGSSLLDGWVKALKSDCFFVAEHHAKTHETLQERWKMQPTPLKEICTQCDILVLAIKPHHFKTVCTAVDACLPQHQMPLIISVAAGIQSETLLGYFKKNTNVVRCMPNIGCLVGEGMSVLFGSTVLSKKQEEQCNALFSCVGKVLWVKDERFMHTVTALSGSGPAYFLLLAQQMVEFGMRSGLSNQDAEFLVQQTLFGTAVLWKSTQDAPEQLRTRVTSKGGTTQHAVDTLLVNDFSKLCRSAFQAAVDRSVSLK